MIDYLLNHGDSIIKYRIITEFKNDYEVNFLNKAKEELLMNTNVRKRLDFLSNFEVAVNHSWFKKVYKLCKKYKLENGMYQFPKESMVENESNWVYGNHISYGENRRKKDSLLLESTFKMLCIENNINRDIII